MHQNKIFTVTHVFRYGEAKFVVSKKRNSEKKIGFGSDGPSDSSSEWGVTILS